MSSAHTIVCLSGQIALGNYELFITLKVVASYNPSQPKGILFYGLSVSKAMGFL